MSQAPNHLRPPWIAREAAILAAYAVHSRDTAGRRHAEPPHPYRGPYERDRGRLVHSAAFRRLSAKMQVFTGELGDYHRTRLTHTLEVLGVARGLARALALNEDLVEALALAHDLGHPPFGHAGEDALDECLRAAGGFDHNRHTLRIVEELEQRYPDFPGLNLSIEVLEGQATRVHEPASHSEGSSRAAAPQSPPLEVQVVDAADSVAYSSHDADDALELELLTLDELSTVALWREAHAHVRRRYQALADKELKRAVLRELLNWQVGDLLAATQARLAAAGIGSVAAVQAAPRLVEASRDIAQMKREFERFFYDRVYRHAKVLAVRRQAQAMLVTMFAGYCRRPELMPSRYQSRIAAAGLERTVGDYLAGMTDRYARQQAEKHFGQV